MLTIIEKANPYTQTVNAVINEYTNELTKIKTKIESTTNTIQQQAVATLNKIEQMPAAETFDLASLQQQITSLQDILYDWTVKLTEYANTLDDIEYGFKIAKMEIRATYNNMMKILKGLYFLMVLTYYIIQVVHYHLYYKILKFQLF